MKLAGYNPALFRTKDHNKERSEKMDVAHVLHMNAGNCKCSYAENSVLQVKDHNESCR